MDLTEVLLRQADLPSERPGTRSLSRLIKLLRMVASRPQFGWRLSDLAAACNLDRATVHRMLACMIDERLVEQHPGDRHYFPGPLLFELGLARPDHLDFQRRAERVLDGFARRTGGIGVLLLRSGHEYVCSLRVGLQPLSGSVLFPGTRRPLFTSAGGVAILQTLPAEEGRLALLDNVTQEVARCGSGRLASLQRMRERSDRHGFGVNLGDVVPGVHAFAVPVRARNGQAFASVCLLGSPEQFGEERLPAIHGELMALASTLAAEAAQSNL